MPSCYAHYRFGAEMLHFFPDGARKLAQRDRALYDAGTHGPDFFFYDNPFRRTAVVELGSKAHRLTGKAFFGRVVRNLHLMGDERGKAYLYGVLTHFALDSVCHPLIVASEKAGVASHTAMESEFDRFLLELDGKNPPENQDLSLHLRLTAGQRKVISRIYGDTERKHVDSCLQKQYFYTKLLCIGGWKRRVLRKGMEVVAESALDMLIPDQPNMRCREINERLADRYRKAAAVFPGMAEQLHRFIEYNIPLGEEFSVIFG